jgi:LPS sulfotransferase NodH
VGFKLMYDQTRDHAGLLELLALRRCRVVHLVRRDHLRALVSFDLATARGAWHHYQGDVWRGTQVRIDPSRLVRRIEDREAEIAHFRRRLRRLPLRTMEVQYERLVERRDEALRSIFEFLGVPSAETAVSSTMLPSAVPSLADAIQNVDEVRSALSKTRFAPQLAAIT